MSNSSGVINSGDPHYLSYTEINTGSRIEDLLNDLNNRLELLESNVKVLPSLVAEAVLQALQECAMDSPDLKGVPVDCCGNTLKTSNGTEADSLVSVDTYPLFERLLESVRLSMAARVSMEEIDRLRDRIRELEEDMGYRKTVARRLMEDPKGNRR